MASLSITVPIFGTESSERLFASRGSTVTVGGEEVLAAGSVFVLLVLPLTTILPLSLLFCSRCMYHNIEHNTAHRLTCAMDTQAGRVSLVDSLVSFFAGWVSVLAF